MKNNNKQDNIERFGGNCKKCGHDRSDHCGSKQADKNPNYLYGHCSKCDCKIFEPKKLDLIK